MAYLIQDLCPELTRAEIVRIASETEFCKRTEKKISSDVYLSFMCQESIRGTVSHNDLAVRICLETDCKASRQAFFIEPKSKLLSFLNEY